MRIHVTDGYFVGFGRHIAPGDYEDGDAGLFGTEAGYLASNGHATVLPDVATPITDEEAAKLTDAEVTVEDEEVEIPDAEPLEEKPLEEMTIPELKAFAVENGVDVSKASKKVDYIDAIHTSFEADYQSVFTDPAPEAEADDDAS